MDTETNDGRLGISEAVWNSEFVLLIDAVRNCAKRYGISMQIVAVTDTCQIGSRLKFFQEKGQEGMVTEAMGDAYLLYVLNAILFGENRSDIFWALITKALLEKLEHTGRSV